MIEKKKKKKKKIRVRAPWGNVMVSKLNKQTFTREFESHWVPNSFGLVPQVSKKLSKLLFNTNSICLILHYGISTLEGVI